MFRQLAVTGFDGNLNQKLSESCRARIDKVLQRAHLPFGIAMHSACEVLNGAYCRIVRQIGLRLCRNLVYLCKSTMS